MGRIDKFIRKRDASSEDGERGLFKRLPKVVNSKNAVEMRPYSVQLDSDKVRAALGVQEEFKKIKPDERERLIFHHSSAFRYWPGFEVDRKGRKEWAPYLSSTPKDQPYFTDLWCPSFLMSEACGDGKTALILHPEANLEDQDAKFENPLSRLYLHIKKVFDPKHPDRIRLIGEDRDQTTKKQKDRGDALIRWPSLHHFVQGAQFKGPFWNEVPVGMGEDGKVGVHHLRGRTQGQAKSQFTLLEENLLRPATKGGTPTYDPVSLYWRDPVSVEDVFFEDLGREPMKTVGGLVEFLTNTEGMGFRFRRVIMTRKGEAQTHGTFAGESFEEEPIPDFVWENLRMTRDREYALSRIKPWREVLLLPESVDDLAATILVLLLGSYDGAEDLAYDAWAEHPHWLRLAGLGARVHAVGRKRRPRDEDEDDEPRGRRPRGRDAEEDEDDEPVAARGRQREEDEDDEDEAPRPARRPAAASADDDDDDDDDEFSRPARGRSRAKAAVDDDEDGPPDDEEDEDDFSPPSRPKAAGKARARDDDEDDDGDDFEPARPKAGARKGAAPPPRDDDDDEDEEEWPVASPKAGARKGKEAKAAADDGPPFDDKPKARKGAAKSVYDDDDEDEGGGDEEEPKDGIPTEKPQTRRAVSVPGLKPREQSGAKAALASKKGK